MKKILLVHILLLSGFFYAAAQVPTPSQMQQVKVDELSDDQVRQIVEEMKKNHISLDQIDGYAQQKGISAGEAAKLKDRIRSKGLDSELNYTAAPPAASDPGRGKNTTITSASHIKPVSPLQKKIFGAELFSNQNLTFEPNLRMPTPPNYRLAADDEVVIDVYGFSEVQHKLKVSPEGYIRIPYLGPVYVNGLTISDATSRITKQLGTIYGGIKAGNTFVQVSLGAIRSIQVLLIGEVVRPGTYTLPSLASVANALYVSGGPDENGSFRDIQVIRNGTPVVSFDLYSFLTNGDLSNNIILQDQDIIKVNAYKSRVELAGQVKHPAIFEVKEHETLETILNYAGGFTDIAYRDNIRANRINNKEREIVNIPWTEVPGFKMRSGDLYIIDSILSRFSNRVTITGSVFHPGVYALDNNMTVSDLIKQADGVKEEASLSRAIIFRLNDDFTPSSFGFNLQDVLSGTGNIRLQREDSVVIYSKFILREKFKVRISGQVNSPGEFEFADSLQIGDLILMAGGLTDAASLNRIEVARRIRNKEYSLQDSVTSIVAHFNLTDDLSTANGFVLEPYDEVIVRRSPNYEKQSAVSINGEVVYPGNYIINTKTEKISDLLKRAGGLRNESYPEGAILMRKTFVTESDSALLNSKLAVFYNKLQDSTNIYKMQNAIKRNEQLVGINLTEILKRPGSKYDLLLEEGDVIKIPKRLQTIQVFGEVYFPKKVIFDKKSAFRTYIRNAGGFTDDALKRRSYVVYANGEVKSTRKLFFFNSHPKVRPGAEIYVPSKKEGKKLSGQEVLGLGTGLASIALIIFTILNKTQ